MKTTTAAGNYINFSDEDWGIHQNDDGSIVDIENGSLLVPAYSTATISYDTTADTDQWTLQQGDDFWPIGPDLGVMTLDPGDAEDLAREAIELCGADIVTVYWNGDADPLSFTRDEVMS